MPSRLSSLLVRDGLVGVKRMEKAFQRQVIYGGSLDTILLEMSLLPEERLTQYLSLSSGLPPATRTESNVFDPEAVRRLDEDTAHKFRVAPLCLDGDALRVLVCDPVDMEGLEELADIVDLPIQPLIVPEYRWHVVFARSYGTSAPARYTTLAKQVESAPPVSPVGKPRTVIIEAGRREVEAGESSSDHIVVDVVDPPRGPAGQLAAAAASLAPVPPGATTLRTMPAVEPVPEHVGDELTERTGAPAAISPATTPRTRTQELSVDSYTAHLASAEETRRELAQKRNITAPAAAPPVAPSGPISQPIPVEAAPIAGASSSGPSQGVPRLVEPSGPVIGDAVIRGTVDATSDRRSLPMSALVAREALQVAEDRDEIFLVLLRALRSRARYAGLLTVQGGAAIGRVAIAEPALDVGAIASVLIPLDTPSAFRTAIQTQRPHVGAIATGDPDIDGMLDRLGGVPHSALLLPIVLRDRAVAIAIAHRVDVALTLADVAELLPLAVVAADSLGRLIVKHKAAGYRAPEVAAPAVVQVSVEDVATKRIDRPASAWRIPTAQPAVPIEHGTELTVNAEPPRPAAELLEVIDGPDERAADGAITEAIERAGEVVPLLAGRFPGRLRVDRYQVSGRALRAAQYGGLLDLTVRIGPPTTDMLIEKMSDPHRDVRFYASVCVAELRPRSAVYALVERLFDLDYGVRAVAMEALAGYPLRDLDAALARARHALHSEDHERVLAAAAAIAELADVAALPDLIDVVGRDSRRAEHARRALIALTKQDLGTSERRWRKWWEEHRKQHRIEWLIEGLGHKETAIRQSAAEDLRKLTGEHFGYHHDLPKRDREQSQQRWQQWWRETGRRRFARDDDERMRPTATLPSLKRD